MDTELYNKLSTLTEFKDYLDDKNLKAVVIRMTLAHYKGTPYKRPYIAKITQDLLLEMFGRNIPVDPQAVGNLDKKINQ